MDVIEKYCCPHCKDVHIDELLVYELVRIEKLFEIDIIVLSAFRCKEHNNKVGGKDRSYHLRGEAVDFTCGSLDVLDAIARNLEARWTGGYKYYRDRRFIHIDIGPHRTW